HVPYLITFPKRRTSDLKILNPKGGIYLNNSAQVFGSVVGSTLHMSNSAAIHVDTQLTGGGLVGGRGGGGGGAGSTKIVAAMEVRSEEHTSELQSRENLV